MACVFDYSAVLSQSTTHYNTKKGFYIMRGKYSLFRTIYATRTVKQFQEFALMRISNIIEAYLYARLT